MKQLDVYHEAAVAFFVERPGMLMTGSDFKRFGLLGDRVAATILVTIPEPRLFEPEVVARIERILTMAFPDFGDDRGLSTMPYLSIYLARKLLANVQSDGPSAERMLNLIDRLESIRANFLKKGRALGRRDAPYAARMKIGAR